MHFRDLWIRFLVFALVLLSCAPAWPMQPSDEAFAHQLLTTWLVRRNLAAVRLQLAPDFFVKEGIRDPSAWPAALQSLPVAERVLRFPSTCDNAPHLCATVGECAKAVDGPGEFDAESRTIDDNMIGANPELRPRKGHDALLLDFIIKGCNVGALVTIDKTDGRRIVTVLYIVG